MEKANEFRMFKAPLNDEQLAEKWSDILSEMPMVKEIFAKAEQISDPVEMEAFLDAELKKIKFGDILEDALYNIPDGCTVTVFLLPGFASFRLQSPGFFKLAKKMVPLEDYQGTIFVFRSKARDRMAEVRVGRNESLWLVENGGSFIDPDWPDDETDVKVLSMQDYKVLLKRMLRNEKILI